MTNNENNQSTFLNKLGEYAVVVIAIPILIAIVIALIGFLASIIAFWTLAYGTVFYIVCNFWGLAISKTIALLFGCMFTGLRVLRK